MCVTRTVEILFGKVFIILLSSNHDCKIYWEFFTFGILLFQSIFLSEGNSIFFSCASIHLSCHVRYRYATEYSCAFILWKSKSWLCYKKKKLHSMNIICIGWYSTIHTHRATISGNERKMSNLVILEIWERNLLIESWNGGTSNGK